ncbi:hypothetical protein MRX96_032483 [Rhipicephalus microplus]
MCSSGPCCDVTHKPGKPRAEFYIGAMLAHALLPFQQFCSATTECVAGPVRIDGVDTSVASVYLRPVIAATCTTVPRLAAALARGHALCGYFNAHHVPLGLPDARGRDFSDVISSVGLLVFNSEEPAFIHRSVASTVIDLALVSERCSYKWKRLADTTGSDHYLIPLLQCHASGGAIRKYRVVRWPPFRELCGRVPSSDYFFLRIADCAERATTRCVLPASTPPCPDMKLLNLCAVRQRARRRALRSSVDGTWTEYNRMDTVCRRHAQRLRDRSRTGVCSSLKNPRRCCHGWHNMHMMINPKVALPTPRNSYCVGHE